MAALIDHVHLRRQALPVHVSADLDREIGRCEVLRPFRRNSRRPRLIANWHVGAEGCLVCAWSVDKAAPDIPSG